MVVADTLSRAYLEHRTPAKTEVKTEHVHATQFLSIPDHQMKELQQETAADPTLQLLKKVILDGFPDSKDSLPVSIHPYFGIRDELSEEDLITRKKSLQITVQQIH